MGKRPLISIIIVHYNVKKELFACLQSIFTSSTKRAYEVIVVDNDEAPSLEKELIKTFPKVIYIKNEKNDGYSGGNNKGAQRANGEFLFFLNPDTLIEKNTIDTLVHFLEKEKNVGIVAPLLLDPKGHIYPLQGARELTPKRAFWALSFVQKLFPNNSAANEYWIKSWDKKETKEVDVVPGSAFMIRKELFEKVHGFDETYFLYFEEHDICNRIKKEGYKIFMVSAATVVHAWGVSTKKSEKNIKAIFEKSRLHYFQKFYGWPQALLVESMLRFSKTTLVFSLILGIGSYLLFYEVEKYLQFIGDFAWFYVSARDMLLTGNIPLVGIASSHPWIHQGAFWTYFLAPALFLGNFHPVAGGYLAGIIGVATLLCLYFITKHMFDIKTALFTTAFFATSPLVVMHARLPYHTAPIPLFVILFMYCLYKWVKGNTYFFPAALFFLVVLYNFELATAVFGGVVILLIFFGLYYKTSWMQKILNTRIFMLSLGAIFVPLLPMLLYDVSHGFPQTVLFVAWLGYRILVFFGYPPLHPEIKPQTMFDMVTFLRISGQEFYYVSSKFIAGGIALVSFFVFLTQWIKLKSAAYYVVGLCFFFPLLAIIISKTPSEAYLPMLFAQGAFVVGICFAFISRHYKQYQLGIGIFFLLFIISNAFSLIAHDFLVDPAGSIPQRVKVAQEIISTANGREYTILGSGPGSQFTSFTMPYEYLTWWMGYPESNYGVSIQVSEAKRTIQIQER